MNHVAVVNQNEISVITVGEQGPPGPAGEAGPAGSGAPFWWIEPVEVVTVAERTQYVVHGEFRVEGEVRAGLNAEIRVMA